jgi:hypothetical protein
MFDVICQMWWCTPIILALGKLRHENRELQAILGCISRPYLKKRRKKKRKPLGVIQHI